MIKQVIGKLASLGAIAGMSVMVYFNNYEYLNVVTIYFTLILLLYALIIPIAALCLAVEKGDKNAVDVAKMFRAMIKVKSGFRGFVNNVEAVATIILLSVLGYTFMVVLYVIAKALFITIANQAKKWVKDYKEENELLAELVLKAMKESADGKVITSKAFREKLAKMKEELK